MKITFFMESFICMIKDQNMAENQTNWAKKLKKINDFSELSEFDLFNSVIDREA